MARSYLARRTDLAFRPLFFMSLIGFKHAPAAVAFGPAVRNRPALLLARGFLGRRVDDASASELGLVTGCNGFKAALRRALRGWPMISSRLG
jgi:hypothetical protein